MRSSSATRSSPGARAGNTVVLPDASVSRRHAQVEPNGNFSYPRQREHERHLRQRALIRVQAHARRVVGGDLRVGFGREVEGT
jgi:pSer/pThr/pTyr-binding forkhead associated (FHA) protein